MDYFTKPRNSSLTIGTIYFWTATINNWQTLLDKDHFKQFIIDSLTHLSQRKLIDVYGFVIMPNHIHLIWKLNDMNGKEPPSASLLKFTAHQFKKMLEPDELPKHYVDAPNKTFEFWQRDSLCMELYTPEVAYQKLNYIHLNPLNEKWNLVTDPSDYEFSSASYYENGSTHFSFLKHLGEQF